MGRLDDLMLVEGRQLRKIMGLAEHQFGDARGFGAAQAQPPHRHGVAQQVGRAAFKGIELGIPLGKAASNALPDHRLEQLFLARKIQEQRAFGHPGTPGDLFGLGGCKAFFNKQIQRSIQQLPRPRLFAACMAAHQF